MSESLIFDLGANEGLNLPYYLLKADRVVAVEANPQLASHLRSKFSNEIASGRAVVIDRAISLPQRAGDLAEFFVYCGEKEQGHVLSSLEAPKGEHLEDFRQIQVRLTCYQELVDEFGQPEFVKIDLERHDAQVLADVIAHPLRPRLLSVEAHDHRVLGHLLLSDGYHGFQVVRGRSVPFVFRQHPVRVGSEIHLMDFPRHSAGPFGDDLPGPWMDRPSLVALLGQLGFGWIDIHASLRKEDHGVAVDYRDLALQRMAARDLIMESLRLWVVVGRRVVKTVRDRLAAAFRARRRASPRR